MDRRRCSSSLHSSARPWHGSWGAGCSREPASPRKTFSYADVGSTFPHPAPLISKRYRLSGKPDYLVRVKDGVAPVELKSSQSPSSGRPYDGHLFQLAAYCLLVEDVCRVSVPYGLVKYEDRTIRVEYTPSLRASLIALLDEIHTATLCGECHINHIQPSKFRSCGFRSICGESLI